MPPRYATIESIENVENPFLYFVKVKNIVWRVYHISNTSNGTTYLPPYIITGRAYGEQHISFFAVKMSKRQFMPLSIYFFDMFFILCSDI